MKLSEEQLDMFDEFASSSFLLEWIYQYPEQVKDSLLNLWEAMIRSWYEMRNPGYEIMGIEINTDDYTADLFCAKIGDAEERAKRKQELRDNDYEN